MIYHAFCFSSARTDLFGGQGGTPFDDVQGPPGTQVIVGITTLWIRHGIYIESIRPQYTLADSTTMTPNAHGGTSEREIRIPVGPSITEIRGVTDRTYLLDMTIFTTDGGGVVRGYGLHSGFGLTGLQPFSVQQRIIGFYGRGGGLIDALGFYYIGQLEVSLQLGC